MSGELSEEHVAGPFGLAGEDGGAKWNRCWYMDTVGMEHVGWKGAWHL